MHLTEFLFVPGGEPIEINPLRRSGKLHPYVDRAPPAIREIRYAAPATPRWARRPRTTVAKLPQAGTRLNKAALTGKVDVRVRVHDPQSYIGWFKDLPHLAAPHHPFRLSVTIVDLARERVVVRREAFRAEQMLDQPAGQHFAPGTEQNLPANGCMLFHRSIPCDGDYWFRLFPTPVLGHDEAPGRPLPAARPRLGRGGEPEQGRLDRHPPQQAALGRSSPSQRTAPGSWRSR